MTDDWGRIQYHEVTTEEERDEQGNVLCPRDPICNPS